MAADNTIAELQVLIGVAMEKLDGDMAEAKRRVQQTKDEMNKPGAGGGVFDGMLGSGLKFAAAIKAFEVGFRSLTVAVKLVQGDIEGVIEAAKRIPLLGPAVDAWWQFSLAVTGAQKKIDELAEKEKKYLADAAEQNRQRAITEPVANALWSQADRTKFDTKKSGLDPQAAAIAESEQRLKAIRKAADDAVQKAGGEKAAGSGAVRQAQAAAEAAEMANRAIKLQEVENQKARENADLRVDIEVAAAKAKGDSLRAQELEVRRSYANMRKDAVGETRAMLAEVEEAQIAALRAEDQRRKDEEGKRKAADDKRKAEEKARKDREAADKKRQQESDVVASTASLQQKALEVLGKDIEANVVGINEQYRTQIEAAERDGNTRLAVNLKRNRDFETLIAKQAPNHRLKFQQFEVGRMSFGGEKRKDPNVTLQEAANQILKQIAKNTGKPTQAVAA